MESALRPWIFGSPARNLRFARRESSVRPPGIRLKSWQRLRRSRGRILINSEMLLSWYPRHECVFLLALSAFYTILFPETKVVSENKSLARPPLYFVSENKLLALGDGGTANQERVWFGKQICFPNQMILESNLILKTKRQRERQGNKGDSQNRMIKTANTNGNPCIDYI